VVLHAELKALANQLPLPGILVFTHWICILNLVILVKSELPYLLLFYNVQYTEMYLLLFELSIIPKNSV